MTKNIAPVTVSYGRTNMDAADIASYGSAKAFADAKETHPDFAVVMEGAPRRQVLEDLYKQAKDALPAEAKEIADDSAKDVSKKK